jgi:hypothetical protein
VVPDIPLVRRLPYVAPPSANSQVRVRVSGEAGPIPKTAPYALAPMLDATCLDWLARAPDVLGQFLVLSFFCDGEPVGTTISRLQELPSFGTTAQIVHVHAARFEIVDWMVGATVHELISRGVGAVSCRTSCPATASAMSKLGFWRRKPSPAYWWGADKPAPAGSLHLTTLQADDALQFR